MADELQDERFANLPSFVTADMAQEFEDIAPVPRPSTRSRDSPSSRWDRSTQCRTASPWPLGACVIKLEDGDGDPQRRSFGRHLASTKATA